MPSSLKLLCDTVSVSSYCMVTLSVTFKIDVDRNNGVIRREGQRREDHVIDVATLSGVVTHRLTYTAATFRRVKKAGKSTER